MFRSRDEQQFKGPREHHPELVSSSLVSKDVMMKKALGFDSDGSDVDVSDNDAFSDGEAENIQPNGQDVLSKVELQAMQYQIQTKDRQREELMTSLKKSQSELMKCRRELNKEKNSKSLQMKLLKKSHSDAIEDKQKLIEGLKDVVEEKENVIEEVSAQLQGEKKVKPKERKTNSIQQLVDQISRLHREKAALNEASVMSRQECDTLRKELVELEERGRSEEKSQCNGVKLEALEEQEALIQELQDENSRLKQQLEEIEDTDTNMEQSLSKMEGEVQLLTERLKEAQSKQKQQDGMQREKEEISQQLKDLDRRASKAESEEKKAKESLKALCSEKEKLERNLSVRADEIKRLKLELTQHKAVAEQQGKKQSDIASENSGLKVELARQSDRVKVLQSDLSKIERVVSEQEAEVEKLQSEGRMLRQMVSDRDDLERQLRHTTDKVETAKKEMEKMEENIKLTEQKAKEQLASAKEEQRVAVSIVKKRAESEMKGLKTKVSCMLVRVSDVTREMETVKVAYKELRESHSLLHTAIGPAIRAVKSKMLKAIAEIDETNKALVTKYQKEMRLRKQLHNEIIELKGNIRVFCRVRPTIREDGSGPLAQHVISFDHDDDQLVHVMTRGSLKTFEMNNVFQPNSTQERVFAEVKGLVTSCMDGYNVCIFAYGQTGSGKTFTMEGTEKNPGVNPRALHELFAVASQRSQDWEYAITMSVLEIYNEQIRDLLGEDPAAKMDIRQQTDGRLYVPGLNWVQVKSREDVQEVFALGHENRVTACTNMNEHSSRSHALLCVNVQGTNKATGSRTAARLNLIDLAGSERVSKSGTDGERLKEAQSINKSLSSLGDVIHALRGKSSHVPFRNSKLTYLLQDSLSGDSKTLMIVQVAPVEKNVGETMCSLNFASRVRTVELGQASKTSESAEIAALKDRLRLYEDPSAVSQVTGLPKRGSAIPTRKK